MDDPEQVQRLRQGARESYEQFYTAETNYQTMMSIYRKASERFNQSPQRRSKTDTPRRPQAAV